MPTLKEDRLNKIASMYQEKGEIETAKHFGITIESLMRYMRIFKKKPAQVIQTPQATKQKEDPIWSKLKEKFSEDEIQALLNANTSRKPIDNAAYSFSGKTVRFLSLGDTHIGSKFFDETKLLSAFKEAEKQECQFMLHSGDVTEGMSARPGQIYELEDIGQSAQVNHAVRVLSQWKEKIFFITGNHDGFVNSKTGVGIDVGMMLQDRLPNSKFVGYHQGIVDVNGSSFMLWHGTDGNSYSTSYRPQKIVEAFNGGEKPHALFCGHTHKMLYMFDRNVHIVSTGCIEDQSDFMKFNRLAAHVGFWICEATINGGEIKKFTSTWHPFYI
jgi:predicted phosphodiesterase